MAFHPRDLKSDEHRKRYPLGRVPALEDGDISIYESGATPNRRNGCSRERSPR